MHEHRVEDHERSCCRRQVDAASRRGKRLLPWRVLAVRLVYPCTNTHLPTNHSLTAPQRRLSMADALRHPFFDDVDKVNVGTVPLEGMGSEVAEAQ